LSHDQFSQLGSPNGKIASAMVVPQMAKYTLPCVNHLTKVILQPK